MSRMTPWETPVDVEVDPVGELVAVVRAELSPRQWLIWVATEVGGWSARRIARELHVSRRHVHDERRRVRQKLRRLAEKRCTPLD